MRREVILFLLWGLCTAAPAFALNPTREIDPADQGDLYGAGALDAAGIHLSRSIFTTATGTTSYTFAVTLDLSDLPADHVVDANLVTPPGGVLSRGASYYTHDRRSLRSIGMYSATNAVYGGLVLKFHITSELISSTYLELRRLRYSASAGPRAYIGAGCYLIHLKKLLAVSIQSTETDAAEETHNEPTKGCGATSGSAPSPPPEASEP